MFVNLDIVSLICLIFRYRNRDVLAILALFSLGMIQAETVRVHWVAAAIPHLAPTPQPATIPSTERRLQRFLANDRVTVESI